MYSPKIIGKYLDQPKLIKRFSAAIPAVLVIGGLANTMHVLNHTKKKDKRKEFIKNVAVLTGTIASALAAPKIASKLVKDPHHHHEHCEHIEKMVDDFIKNNKVSEKVAEYLNEAKTKILGIKKIDAIYKELGENKEAKNLLNSQHGLIPDPENIDSNHIFEEMKRLSVMGVIPVLGGILGGITGDKITEKNWKDKIPNKVKEGTYQYLANIFLCNIGAGAALWGLEKAKITSKTYRAVGMIGGIIITGIIGGSAIANLIGKIFIDPIFEKRQHQHHHIHKHKKESLYAERKPELLDMGLHVDDIATVAVLSGLKWIEPALPVLYAISGYRAGIGYRNEHKYDFLFNHSHFMNEANKRQAFSTFQ